MVRKANEPAFPEARFENDPAGIGQGILHYPGLTKREYFAAMAMQGLLQADEYEDELFLALSAIEIADAILARLENK